MAIGAARNKSQYTRERKIYKETGKVPWEIEVSKNEKDST